jgi:hypothetical protein
MVGVSGSAFRGELTEGLMMGGGDLRRGETGHRGDSFSSGFTGVGDLTTGSDGAGCSCGVFVADKARCIDAADGGFEATALAAREGLTS